MSTKQNSGDATSRLVDSVDHMMRWPIEMTGATWDLMMEGMQSMATGRPSGPSGESTRSSSGGVSGVNWTSMFTGRSDQDLGGDDLKYVIWSLVFTKPGFECVLEPQHEEMVNYAADRSSFAALKIAKLLEAARHGRVRKPESWGDDYPPDGGVDRRAEAGRPEASGEPSSGPRAGGWRIPPEDNKYIKFLYRVDRRLPKEASERAGTTEGE
jgi:hypothetical protein